MKIAALAIALLAACGQATPPAPALEPGSPEALAAYLDEIAAYPPAARAAAERGWELPPAAWNRIVVPPFRDPLYADYAARFSSAIAAIDATLAPGRYTARRHYADDPRATPGELVLRWAVPVLYPSVIADRDGHPIDAVFLWDDGGWRTLAGADRAILDRSRALDPACTELFAGIARKECSDVDYLIADAAVRDDRAAFARACRLAAAHCGIRSPHP